MRADLCGRGQETDGRDGRGVDDCADEGHAIPGQDDSCVLHAGPGDQSRKVGVHGGMAYAEQRCEAADDEHDAGDDRH